MGDLGLQSEERQRKDRQTKGKTLTMATAAETSLSQWSLPSIDNPRTSAAPAHSACAELGGQVRKLPTSEQIGQVRHVSATGREVGRNLRQSMDGQRDRRLLRLRSQPDTQHEQRQFRVSIIKVSAGLHLSRLSLGLFLPASVCASVSESVCLCVSVSVCL